MERVASFVFAEGNLADLVDMLEPRPDRRHAVELHLKELATRYWTWHRQRENEPTRAGERHNLAVVEQRAQDLLDAICTAGPNVESLLGFRLLAAREEGLPAAEALQQLKVWLLELQVPRRAETFWKEAPDRRPPPELTHVVRELSNLFCSEKGAAFTHTRGPRGEPISPLGLFVAAFFRGVDPTVSHSRLSTELDRVRLEVKRSVEGQGSSRARKVKKI